MKRFSVLLVVVLAIVVNAAAQDRLTRIERLMRQYQDDWGFTGTVVVAENCATVFARGYGMADREHGLPNGPRVYYRIASVTKTFTSTLIMKLVEEGKISLHEPISTYLPSYRNDTGRDVTLHQLLTHTSGIPDYAANPDFRARVRGPMPALDTLIERYCSGDLEFTPGTKFVYSNSGYVLLGAIIEQVTGQPYEQILRSVILHPAGMHESGLDREGLELPARAVGYAVGFGEEREPVPEWNLDWAYAAGGMYATPEDMIRWDHALYDEVLIKRPTLRLMTTPHTQGSRPGTSYGYGFSLARRPLSRSGDSLLIMSHAGGVPGFNSLFSRVPATKQMVFVVSNASAGPLQQMTQGILRILNGLEPDPVQLPLAQEIFKAIEAKGLEAGLRAVESARYADPGAYHVAESDINALGYHYVAQKKYAEAAAIFSLNVREFPRSWNTYDSLGECYAAMGEKEKAIASYRRSLEMNPANEGGRQALRRLGIEPEGPSGTAR